MHRDDRISMEPGTPSKGDRVKIEYRGLLAQSGADSVWLHCGFDGWKSTKDIQMERTLNGAFSCHTEVLGNREMNLCFKDSADHWDNNNGYNWNVTIK